MSSQPIFGANLEEAIRISHIPDTPMVPAVLHRCAQFLEAKGVDEVGLYRYGSLLFFTLVNCLILLAMSLRYG